MLLLYHITRTKVTITIIHKKDAGQIAPTSLSKILSPNILDGHIVPILWTEAAGVDGGPIHSSPIHHLCFKVDWFIVYIGDGDGKFLIIRDIKNFFT